MPANSDNNDPASEKRSSGRRDRSGSPAPKRTRRVDKRIYVSNIPYDFRWQDLKDLFRREVGEVAYAELFMDENDKSRGCGILEFDCTELAVKALDKMHRFDIKGRKLVVKEDNNVERDKQGRPIGFGGRSVSSNNAGGGSGNRSGNRDSHRSGGNSNSGGNEGVEAWSDAYGLSPTFLKTLGISGPLMRKVFVANLDYKVDEKKLREVFRLAGRVVDVDLAVDKENKSRGFGTVEYEHPVEAVQAISMFHNQMLYDRRMNVRLDKLKDNDGHLKLPDGLKGIGMGLGTNGSPLTDIEKTLSSGKAGSGGSSMNTTAPATNPFATATPFLSSLGQTSLGLATGLGHTHMSSSLDTRSLLDAASRRQLDLLLANTSGDLGLGGRGLGRAVDNNSPPGNYSERSAMRSMNNGRNVDSNYMDMGDYRSGNSGSIMDRMDTSLGGSGLGGGRSLYDRTDSGTRGVSSIMDSKINFSDMILVTNLPPNTSWQDLRERFSEYGEIQYAEMKGPESGVVRFAQERFAHNAARAMNGARVDGRSLGVTVY